MVRQTAWRDTLRSFAGCMSSQPVMVCENRNGYTLQLCCRRLSEADYAEVRDFEWNIMTGIPNNEAENIYQPFDESGLRNALATGWAVGLYDGPQDRVEASVLAAFLYVIPRPQPDHNVLMDVLEEVGLTSVDVKGRTGAPMDQKGITVANPMIDPSDVMITDCILVGQEYRGYGLQRALFYLADCMAEREGISRLCGTASPKNAHSIRNFEAAGYRCVAVKPKYRSVRCFFVKELASESEGNALRKEMM